MARATAEVCLRVLEKETKVCSTAIVQEQSKDPITPQFQDCHVHIFSDNVSRNSCIQYYVVHNKFYASGLA